jgi:HAD superfamily hydrolase (TIGR01509 family)
MPRSSTAFLFDLDGTLIDSVYQHVLAWKESLDREGVVLPVWSIHRKIGMSGGLFTNILLRETGLDITEERIQRLQQWHAEAFNRHHTQGSVRPLPGARELLDFLTKEQIPWAIATSGRMQTAAHNLAALGVDPNNVPVVTRDMVRHAKPDPDLFLAAAERLGVDIHQSLVIGDSIWDCSPRSAHAHLAWAFFPAAMGRMNCSAPALFASMTTLPIYCGTSTK